MNKLNSLLLCFFTLQSPLSSFFICVQNRYNQAKLSIHDRGLKVAAVVESLEREMELLCLTGVEDQLQADVRPTLELLRNAGIKVSKQIEHWCIQIFGWLSTTTETLKYTVTSNTQKEEMVIFL